CSAFARPVVGIPSPDPALLIVHCAPGVSGRSWNRLPRVSARMSQMRYVTHETIRLGLCGLAAGSAAGLAWWAVGRARWGPLPFVLAVLVAARFTDRSDWPRWDGMAATGAVVVVLAGFGAARLLTESGGGWQWVAAGSLISAA